MSDYVLRGGDDGANRLRLLARVKWPTTRSLLRRAGLRQGMRCLDVGCGQGAVTLHMARWVGPQGSAVGIDTDARCLSIGREAAIRMHLPATFREGNASSLVEESKYDLLFARFLLTHLSDPADAVLRLRQAAIPGGLIVLEDIDFTGHFCYPPCAAFARYLSIYTEVVRQRGGDANIGPRLLGMLLDAGIEDVRLRVVAPTFREGPGKRLADVTLEHIRESVLAAGLATSVELDQLVRELRSFAADARTIMSLPRIFQLWGRRGDSVDDSPSRL